MEIKTVSVDVQKHFTDGDKEIGGGVQSAPVTDALRWQSEGKAVVLDATVSAPANAPAKKTGKPAITADGPQAEG